MKTTNRLFSAIVITFLLLNTTTIIAQEEAQKGPEYVTMTVMHWNMDLEDFKMEEWKAVEKEYMDKVTKKNEHVMAAGFYLHQITPDNRELVYVQAYANWNAIDLAAKRNTELAKDAWPDKDKRKTFLNKQANYYSPFHSDEIYATMPHAKSLSEEPKKDMIVYLRTSHFAFPEDGSYKEFMDTFAEYTKNVTHKNEYVKAYYPMSHAYGSDKTQFVEAYFLDSLAVLDKKFDKDGELFDAHWSDEEAKKEMDKMGKKYFTGVHGDAVYKVVPELRK